MLAATQGKPPRDLFGPSTLQFASFSDHHLTSHVRVKLAVVVHRTVRLENDALGGIGRDQDVPSTVACRRRMRDEVAVHPFKRVADVGRDPRRREGELLDHDPNDLGVRRSGYENEKKRAEHWTGKYTAHRVQPYLNSAATCSACC